MVDTADMTTGRNPIGALRRDRDRFVALAFSAADILLELDADHTVVFAAGATGALLGREPSQLQGRAFAEIVADPDCAMVAEAMSLAKQGSRIKGLVVHLDGAYGVTPPMVMLGYQVQEMAEHFYLALRMGAGTADGLGEDLVETGETGLPGSADFAEAAGARLARLAADDDDYTLTMFRFDDLSGLRERLDDEARERLNSAIGGVLRANAVDGDMASEINSDSYGVIHRPQADVAGLEARLVEITRKADPEAHGVGVRYAALDLDLEGKTADESTKALNYVLNRFAESDAEEFSIENLSGGLSSMMEDAVDRIGAFRDILNNDEFTMAFQPVVDLHTRRPHHFEALARFPNFLGTDEGTYGAITFAEHTGLITEFDLAMCAKVLDWLDQAGRQGMRYKVAVNISGSSIATPSFVSSLHHMLAQYPELRESILFEVTESAKIKDLKGVNRTLQSLRCEGHKVCLDDFGAGAAAFRYLRELEVDVVKIDGAYVKGAIKTEKSMAFLKAMARLCVDLGITTIAEMVEDERSAKFLIDCGIDYGQGYLFGRPSEDISAFEAPRPTDFNKPKVKIAGWGQ